MKKALKFYGALGLVATAVVFTLGCGPGFKDQSKAENFVHDGDKELSQGIIGGSEVADSDPVAASTFAFYIKAPQQDRVTHFCTSSMIDAQVFLTAAHCFETFAAKLQVSMDELAPFLYVGFGTTIAEKFSDHSVKFVQLKTIVIHPEYINSAEALANAQLGRPNPDIALFSIAAQAPESALARPLLRDAASLQEGIELTLAGYGLVMASPFSVPATALRKVNVNLWRPNFNPVQFAYLTTSRKTACRGDSGGPAYLIDSTGDLLIAGVTSFGDKTCSQFGVYTSVPAVIEWIDTEVKNLNSPDQDQESPIASELSDLPDRKVS